MEGQGRCLYTPGTLLLYLHQEKLKPYRKYKKTKLLITAAIVKTECKSLLASPGTSAPHEELLTSLNWTLFLTPTRNVSCFKTTVIKSNQSTTFYPESPFPLIGGRETKCESPHGLTNHNSR